MTKKKRRNLPPTEEELIIFKVWSDMGLTANAIAVKMGRDPKTVRKYLLWQNYFNDYIKLMVKMVEDSYKAEEANGLDKSNLPPFYLFLKNLRVINHTVSSCKVGKNRHTPRRHVCEVPTRVNTPCFVVIRVWLFPYNHSITYHSDSDSILLIQAQKHKER